MDIIDRLQHTLLAVNKVTLSRFRPGDSLAMQGELIRLQAWLRASSGLERFSQPTIERALRNFRQYKYLSSSRELLLVCYGCTQGGDDALIKSRMAFARLLELVLRCRNKRRLFRKLYRALLGSYLSHDPDAASSEMLMAFLADHLKLFPTTKFSPDWLIVLNRYPSLLGDDPASSLLREDWQAYREISERLELGSDAWLVRKLVMSHLMTAIQMDDSSFRNQLPGLLLLLDAYPLYAAEGLKIILDRHGPEHGVDDALGEFAIGLWGNPWLAAQQWLCSEPAREMVAHWLKRQLLQEFFGMLSDDDKSRQRRLDFWELYSGDLTGMYFALGQKAYASEDLTLYKFRQHAKGLIAKFPEEKQDVHTCIMQFEKHHIVEFNHEDSAAYFYDASHGMPSFYFGKGWIDIGAIGAQEIIQGTDMPRLSKPIRHLDGRHLTWEGKFAKELGASMKAIAAFCRKYQCAYDDTQTGQQWIRPACSEKYGREVWSILQGWGFSHSAKEQAYVCMATA